MAGEKGDADTKEEAETEEIKGGRKEDVVDAAQLAAEAQPTGYTFETTNISTKVTRLRP